MSKYILTTKAVEDLSKIWDYTFEMWSEAQADKYYFMLLDLFNELAGGNLSGKKYDEVIKDIFGFRTGRHIIFYRKPRGNKIEIVRILHIRMDLKSRIKD